MTRERDEAVLHQRLEALRQEPVVSLASVRRLQRLVRDLGHVRPERHLLAAAQAMLLECQAWSAARLLDLVERVLAEAGDASVRDLARLVARDWDFLRVSRSMRHSQARWGALTHDGEEIPYVEVGAYTRQGRPVRGYLRYVGYEHLRGLPGLAERPPAVQQVIRCLIDGENLRRS